jgi:hypothetical protein
MRANRDELPILFGADPAAIRGADGGDLRSLILTLPAGTDLTPLLKGLPGDLCPCPHWGYLIKGRVLVTYADSEEVLQAGDLFYLPPGHTALVEEDAEIVEFSPPAQHEPVMDVVRHNALAATA